MNETTRYLQSVTGNENVEVGAQVNYLVHDAIQAGASDIHLDPWESTLVVRVRLNGVLTELVHLPLDFMEKISGRLKVMADLVSYQTDLPQKLPTRKIQELAVSQGMMTLWNNGARRAILGEIRHEEVLRVVSLDQM